MLPILITPLDQPVVARRRRGPSSYAGVVTSPPTLGSRTISSIIFAHAYSTLFRTRLFYSFFLHMPFLLFFLHTLFLLFFAHAPLASFLHTSFPVFFANTFSSLILAHLFVTFKLKTCWSSDCPALHLVLAPLLEIVGVFRPLHLSIDFGQHFETCHYFC